MSRRDRAGREEQGYLGRRGSFVFGDVHPSGQSFATLQNPAGTYIYEGSILVDDSSK
jgi:hypothetical protein